MPDTEPSRIRYIGTVLFFLPSILLTLFPSFDLGRPQLKTPAMSLPKDIVAGIPFILKDTGEALSITMNGRELAHIDQPEPIIVGVADQNSEARADLDILYVGRKRTLKSIFAFKTEHPLVPYYTTQLKINLPPVLVSADTERKPAAQHNLTFSPEKAMAIPKRLLASLERVDGKPTISCFKEPQLKTYEPPPALTIGKPTARNKSLRLFSVTAAGGGQVVFAGNENDDKTRLEPGVLDRTVLIYHGGGFFTRYKNLKEFRVRKGEKVKPGQDIGIMAFDSKRVKKESMHADWEARWGETPVTPPAFLALSSQLCGST